MKLKAILLFAILSGSLAQAQTENSSLTYHVELEATAGNGTYGEPDHGAGPGGRGDRLHPPAHHLRGIRVLRWRPGL